MHWGFICFINILTLLSLLFCFSKASGSVKLLVHNDQDESLIDISLSP